MDVPVLSNQQELIYINSVWKQDVIWKTCWEQWNGWGERKKKSGKSALTM